MRAWLSLTPQPFKKYARWPETLVPEVNCWKETSLKWNASFLVVSVNHSEELVVVVSLGLLDDLSLQDNNIVFIFVVAHLCFKKIIISKSMQMNKCVSALEGEMSWQFISGCGYLHAWVDNVSNGWDLLVNLNLECITLSLELGNHLLLSLLTLEKFAWVSLENKSERMWKKKKIRLTDFLG